MNNVGSTYVEPWGLAENLFLINVLPWWGEATILQIPKTTKIGIVLTRA